MAVWHLNELREAIGAKGWRILSEQPGDGYRISGTWEIQRSERIPPIFVDFDGLNDMDCLPMDQSYSCEIRDYGQALYFRKKKSRYLWREELAAFVSSLDSLESSHLVTRADPEE